MNETSDILLSECITFLGEFLTRQISRNLIIFLIQIKYYLQICFSSLNLYNALRVLH